MSGILGGCIEKCRLDAAPCGVARRGEFREATQQPWEKVATPTGVAAGRLPATPANAPERARRGCGMVREGISGDLAEGWLGWHRRERRPAFLRQSLRPSQGFGRHPASPPIRDGALPYQKEPGQLALGCTPQRLHDLPNVLSVLMVHGLDIYYRNCELANVKYELWVSRTSPTRLGCGTLWRGSGEGYENRGRCPAEAG